MDYGSDLWAERPDCGSDGRHFKKGLTPLLYRTNPNEYLIESKSSFL